MKISVNQPLILLAFLMLVGCNSKSVHHERLGDLWNNPPAHITGIDQAKPEIDHKMQKVINFLDEQGLDAVMLTQVRNFYWITAGLMNNQIVLNKDVGAASAIITRQGRKYLFCNSAEGQRLLDEGMKDLGYEWIPYRWYEANLVYDSRVAILSESLGLKRIGSDNGFPGTVDVSAAFSRLRYSLTENEILRYRWLCHHCAKAVEDVCRKINSGMNEFEIEAITSAELRRYGILPTVLLIAADERIAAYRHALPAGATLKEYAMINIVAEKWGMPVALTRFVYFGDMPDVLKTKFEKTAIVNAMFQKNSVPGAKASDIFEDCKRWYAMVGFENEWQLHHQGGAIGYNDREYILFPGNPEIILPYQAFAWNPTITGAKIENTILVTPEGFEVLTETNEWPQILVTINGKTYPQPGILIRDPKSGKVMEKPTMTVTFETND